MKDNVLALKVVLADGALMSTARRARKSSAGYDLTRLIVGAEGTLGIITELTLKLHGIPEASPPASVRSPSVETACDAAIAAIQAGIPFARIELLDEVQVRACNQDAKLALPETPMLFLEFHGTDAERGRAVATLWRDRPRVRRRPLRMGRESGGAEPPLGAEITSSHRSFRPGSQASHRRPISRLAECLTESARSASSTSIVAHHRRRQLPLRSSS